MALKPFFVHARTKKEFEVVSYNPETRQLMLKGEFSTFPQEFDKAQFEKLGYSMIKREMPDAPATPAESDDDEDED